MGREGKPTFRCPQAKHFLQGAYHLARQLDLLSSLPCAVSNFPPWHPTYTVLWGRWKWGPQPPALSTQPCCWSEGCDVGHIISHQCQLKWCGPTQCLQCSKPGTAALFYLLKATHVKFTVCWHWGVSDSTQLFDIVEKHPVLLCVKELMVPVSRQKKY